MHYRLIKDLPLEQQVEMMTSYLVGIRSINGTPGEVEIAEKIESFLRTFPYFQDHPDNVWTQPLPEDPLGRKNVFARIRGKGNSKRTVIFHAHTDTVGIKDYGKLEDIATSPDKLLAFFQSWDENEEIKRLANSGDWMFGRGVLDMKSGIAVHLANLLYFSEHREEWSGEILFMANPVEENQHSGVIAAVHELQRLKRQDGLEYVVAINDDFVSPLFTGDTTKYIYTGAIGKLLPCFYVFGRETHVGQTLNGLDPTLITSELNRLINNNMELAEEIQGEMILPPSALYHRDTKEFYNVQTSVSSYLYFNYMVYEESPKQIIEKLKKIAQRAAENVRLYYEKQYRRFLQITGLPSSKISWELNVYTYEEFCKQLLERGVDVKEVANRVVRENADVEPRQLCFKIVDTLRMEGKMAEPCIVVFFAPPYCPHHYLKEGEERDEKILSVIKETITRFAEDYGETFAVKRFFPFLSDSSYLALDDTDEEIAFLIDNFPEWESIYPIPVKEIRSLSIPAINVGVYGEDAHRWTERVYKPYTFKILPLIIRDMTKKFLEAKIDIKLMEQ